MIFLFFLAFARSESFITDEEYGKYLYNNPRGIGCAHCHGADASGKTIVKFKDKGVQKELRTNSIVGIDFKKFEKSLRGSKGVMPKYYLSKKERRVLYNYIQGLKSGN